jgi:hypothetical protein
MLRPHHELLHPVLRVLPVQRNVERGAGAAHIDVRAFKRDQVGGRLDIAGDH